MGTHPIAPCLGPWNAAPTVNATKTGIFSPSGYMIAEIPSRAWNGKTDTISAALDVANLRLILSGPTIATILAQAMDYAENATLEGDPLPRWHAEAAALLDAIGPITIKETVG